MRSQSLAAHGWHVVHERTSIEVHEDSGSRCTLRSARCFGNDAVARRNPAARSDSVVRRTSCRCQMVDDTSSGWGEVERRKEKARVAFRVVKAAAAVRFVGLLCVVGRSERRKR